MSSEIERIAEYHDGEKTWRTSCKCMDDEHSLTFTVATDDEFPEVYLEVYMQCCTNYKVWDEPRWSRPFRSFGRRIKGAFEVLFKGHVEVNGAFLFRGEKQIDEFLDTVKTHKDHMVEKRKNLGFKEVNIAERLKDE